jgi:hypothetical protein
VEGETGQVKGVGGDASHKEGKRPALDTETKQAEHDERDATETRRQGVADAYPPLPGAATKAPGVAPTVAAAAPAPAKSGSSLTSTQKVYQAWLQKHSGPEHLAVLCVHIQEFAAKGKRTVWQTLKQAALKPVTHVKQDHKSILTGTTTVYKPYGRQMGRTKIRFKGGANIAHVNTQGRYAAETKTYIFPDLLTLFDLTCNHRPGAQLGKNSKATLSAAQLALRDHERLLELYEVKIITHDGQPMRGAEIANNTITYWMQARFETATQDSNRLDTAPMMPENYRTGASQAM